MFILNRFFYHKSADNIYFYAVGTEEKFQNFLIFLQIRFKIQFKRLPRKN